jgi:hypothetical protein
VDSRLSRWAICARWTTTASRSRATWTVRLIASRPSTPLRQGSLGADIGGLRPARAPGVLVAGRRGRGHAALTAGRSAPGGARERTRPCSGSCRAAWTRSFGPNPLAS